MSVLGELAAQDLVDIDDRDRNFAPPKLLCRAEPALAGNSVPSGWTTTGCSRPISSMLATSEPRSPKSRRRRSPIRMASSGIACRPSFVVECVSRAFIQMALV